MPVNAETMLVLGLSLLPGDRRLRSWIATVLFVGIALLAHAQSTPTIASGEASVRAVHEDGEPHRLTSWMGSAYVPLDSWGYSSFDRLAALGYCRRRHASVDEA